MKGNFVRGIRNNNPFNIKRSRHPWIGKEIRHDSFDPDFEQFSTMELGVRAGLKLLINYVIKGFDTPAKIIQKFAPSSENNTSNYIYYVTRDSYGRLFINPNEPFGSLKAFCMFASRIVKYECSLTSVELYNFKLSPDDMLHIIFKYNLNRNNVL